MWTDLTGDASCEAFFAAIFSLNKQDLEEFISPAAEIISEEIGFEGSVSYIESGLSLDKVRNIVEFGVTSDLSSEQNIIDLTNQVFPAEFQKFLEHWDIDDPHSERIFGNGNVVFSGTPYEFFWMSSIQPHLDSNGLPIYKLGILFDDQEKANIRVSNGNSPIDDLIGRNSNQKAELNMEAQYELSFAAPRFLHQLNITLLARKGPKTVAFEVLEPTPIRRRNVRRWNSRITETVVSAYNQEFTDPTTVKNRALLVKELRSRSERRRYQREIEALAEECQVNTTRLNAILTQS